MQRTARLMASVLAALASTGALAEARPIAPPPAPLGERALPGVADASAANPRDPLVVAQTAATATPGSSGGGSGYHAYGSHGSTTANDRPGCAGRFLRGFGRSFHGGG